MNFTQIKETCLYVKDLARTRQFYQDRLGLELINFTEGRHAFFRVGTSVLLCFLAEATKTESELPPHYGSGNLHLAFEVNPEEYGKARQSIEELNISIEHESIWKNGLRSFYFRDPDGHLLEIVQKGIWE